MLKENDFASHMRDEENYLKTISRTIEEIDLSKVDGFIIVEVQNMNEAMIVVKAWERKIQSNIKNIKIVLLLDNIDTKTVKKISEKLIKNKLREYCILEASGGIDIDSLEDWNKTDIEVISSSKLNRGVRPIDLSMLFEKEGC
jgi:nicotinate-nucleotide pyrophosphorylase